MSWQYLLTCLALSTIASCGIAYIMIDRFGQKWHDAWMDELAIFQANRESMLLEIKMDFLKELTQIRNISEQIPSGCSGVVFEKVNEFAEQGTDKKD